MTILSIIKLIKFTYHPKVTKKINSIILALPCYLKIRLQIKYSPWIFVNQMIKRNPAKVNETAEDDKGHLDLRLHPKIFVRGSIIENLLR